MSNKIHRDYWARGLEHMTWDEAILDDSDSPQVFREYDRLSKDHRRWGIDINGRMHTAFTNLAKLLRKHVKLGGKPIFGADISSSQPALFAGLIVAIACRMRTNGNNVAAAVLEAQNQIRTGKLLTRNLDARTALGIVRDQLGPDAVDFCELCWAGLLYDTLKQPLPPNCLELKKDRLFKERMLATLGRKQGHGLNKVGRVFADKFASVLHVVNIWNAGDHAKLLNDLQRLESDLVLKKAGARLRDQGCIQVLSLHDGVFATEDKVETVQATMEATCATAGFPVRVKIEA